MTKTILLLPKFVLSKMSHESEHSESVMRANFTIQANCPMQNYFSRQLAPKAKKEIKHSSQLKKLKTFSAANKQTYECCAA